MTNFEEVIWTPTDNVESDKLAKMMQNDEAALYYRNLNARGILGRTNKTSNQTVATGGAHVSCISVTATIEKNRFIGLGLFIPFIERNLTAQVRFVVYMDGVVQPNTYYYIGTVDPDNNIFDTNAITFFIVVPNLASGSHTFDFRTFNSGTATFIIHCGDGTEIPKGVAWVEDLGAQKHYA